MLRYENDTDNENIIDITPIHLTAGDIYSHNENLIFAILALFFLTRHNKKKSRRSSSLPSLNYLTILILILLFYSNAPSDNYAEMTYAYDNSPLNSNYGLLNNQEKQTTSCPYEGGYEEGYSDVAINVNKYSNNENDRETTNPYEGGYEEGYSDATVNLDKHGNNENDRKTTSAYEGGYNGGSLGYNADTTVVPNELGKDNEIMPHTIEQSYENNQPQLISNYNPSEVAGARDISNGIVHSLDNTEIKYGVELRNINVKDNPTLSNIEIVDNSTSSLENQSDVQEEDITQNSLSIAIQQDYFGANVTALLKNSSIITGEVVFNFKKIITLKTLNNIVFINKDDIIAFF